MFSLYLHLLQIFLFVLFIILFGHSFPNITSHTNITYLHKLFLIFIIGNKGLLNQSSVYFFHSYLFVFLNITTLSVGTPLTDVICKVVLPL